MDGHDKNKSGGNSTSQAPSGGAQGIFSTPELTVDTNKISQPSTDASSARVSSFFANRPQSDQTAGSNGNFTTQPATQDIHLPQEPKQKKKSKAPLVIIILLLILALGASGFYLISSYLNSARKAQSPLVALQDFKELAENGPKPEEPAEESDEGEESAEQPSNNTEQKPLSDWYVFALDEVNLNIDERTKYIDQLQESFNKFYEKATAEGTEGATYDSAVELKHLLDSYLEADNLFIYAQKFLETFSKDGTQGASKYLEDLVPVNLNTSNQALRATNTNLYEYFRLQVQVLDIYQRQGCIENNTIEPFCAAEAGIDNTTLPEIYDGQNQAYDAMVVHLPALKSDIKDKIQSLINSLGEQQQ